jgi:hypothetical protein
LMSLHGEPEAVLHPNSQEPARVPAKALKKAKGR